MHIKTFFVAACLLLLSACSSQPVARDSATFILVRHAEKATTPPKDPPLTDAGQQRAQRLAESLQGTRLDAIYSSAYQRTQQTATPVAHSQRLTIIDYVPDNATAFATTLRATHPRGTVLIVGHSNTLPPLARALCACEVADMDEAIYGIRYTIRFDMNGRARLVESRD
ncbi:MAG: phosphoglycerate mutase family protein [Thermomonas sp.]